jgi:transcriptional regulator with XRE-family HTH domain
MVTSGQRFAACREFLSLTQEEMAEKVGSSRDAWRRYEAGQIPNGATLTRIAALGFSVDWLLAGVGAMRLTTIPDLPEDKSAGDETGSADAAEDRILSYAIPDDLVEAIEALKTSLSFGPSGYKVAVMVVRQIATMLQNRLKGD